MAQLNGSMVAIVTPMHEDGSLDLDAFRKLIDWHIDEGTDGIVVVGTTGESPTVDFDEHHLLIKTAVEHARRRVPIIAGTGANSTREAIELVGLCETGRRRREPVGRAVLQQAHAGRPLPAFPRDRRSGRHSADRLQRARAAPSPICRTRPWCGWRRCRTSSASRTRRRTSSAAPTCCGSCLPHVAVYSGDDATGLALMLLGGRGVISVTANVAPRLMHEMCVAALKPEPARARELNNRLLGLHRNLFVEANPIPVKWAVASMKLMQARHPTAADAACPTNYHEAGARRHARRRASMPKGSMQ